MRGGRGGGAEHARRFSSSGTPAGYAGGSPTASATTDAGRWSWPVQGDADLAAAMDDEVRRLWQDAHPAAAGATVHALFARTDGVSDVYLGQVLAGGEAWTVVAVAASHTATLYYDALTPPGTVQVSAIVPAATPSGTSLVIVSDPEVTGRLYWSQRGADDMVVLDGTAAEVPLPVGDPTGIQVEVADRDGGSLYLGLVTYDGVPDSEPDGGGTYATSLFDWGSADFGSAAQGRILAIGAAWQEAHHGLKADVVVPLLCCSVGPDATVEVSQVRDQDGAIWDWATYGTGTSQAVLLDRRTPAETGYVAVTYSPAAGSPPHLVVVTDPGMGDVAYAPDGTTFTSAERAPAFPRDTADGRAPAVYEVLRTGAPGRDALRLLDGDGNLDQPFYQGPID